MGVKSHRVGGSDCRVGDDCEVEAEGNGSKIAVIGLAKATRRRGAPAPKPVPHKELHVRSNRNFNGEIFTFRNYNTARWMESVESSSTFGPPEHRI